MTTTPTPEGEPAMPDTTPADPRPATTYRHELADVLVALDRVEHLLGQTLGIPGQEALPVRIGPPLPADAPGKTAADAWNLKVLAEELRAQMEEAVDREAHRSTIAVRVRPELDPEATGDVAAELAEAIAARLVGTGPGPVGITPGAGDRDLALEQAVKLLAGTTNPDHVVGAAAKFAAFLATGQAGAVVEEVGADA